MTFPRQDVWKSIDSFIQVHRWDRLVQIKMKGLVHIRLEERLGREVTPEDGKLTSHWPSSGVVSQNLPRQGLAYSSRSNLVHEGRNNGAHSDLPTNLVAGELNLTFPDGRIVSVRRHSHHLACICHTASDQSVYPRV